MMTIPTEDEAARWMSSIHQVTRIAALVIRFVFKWRVRSIDG